MVKKYLVLQCTNEQRRYAIVLERVRQKVSKRYDGQ
jgi:hypothetical protein